MNDWTKRFAVIDTETTGTGDDARIVEVGVCLVECGEVFTGWSSFVDPGIPIPSEATAVHGITDEMVRGEPDIIATTRRVAELVAEYPLAAYNETFDRRMLFISTGWERTNDPWLDPLVWIREAQKYEKGKKLSDVAARLGIVCSGKAHRAQADAEMTARVLLCLRKPSTWADWSKRMGRHPRDFFPADYDECIRAQEALKRKQEFEFQEWRKKQEVVANG